MQPAHTMIRFPIGCSWLALAVGIGFPGCKSNAPTVFKYETATVSRADLSAYITATGTLNAVVSVDVGSQISGKVIALYADFNSPVKKGDVVAEIDPATYAAAVRQAEGDLASAKAAATLSRQNLERKKTLVPQKAATQADLDQATSEVAQAEATITIKEASLESANANLNYCKIVAPVDGIVISRKVDVGQTVAAAMTTPVLFTIAQDITKMHIDASVSEADIGQVKDGQSVEFNVDAFPDEVFHGKVVQVRMAPTTTENVVTYETIIDVDNPEQKLFPGMTADVSVLVAEHKNILKIPNTALRFTPPEGAKFEKNPPRRFRSARALAAPRFIWPWTEADGATLKPTIVRASITDNVDTEIIEGLSEGDRRSSAVRVRYPGNKSGGPFGK